MDIIKFFRAIGVFSFLAFSLARGNCADVSAELLAKLKPIPACPALVATAKTNHIPLEQIDAASSTNILRPGDSVTALVTLCVKGGTRKQWIVYFEADEPTTKERSVKRSPPIKLYSSFGGAFEFVSTSVPMKLHTLGPFVESGGKKKIPKVEVTTGRFSVEEGFLGLGLEKAPAIILRLKQMHEKGQFDIANAPLDEKVLSQGRKLAAKAKLTAPEERALVGSVPALLSYFSIVAGTEGLSDIISELVELPSAWSMVRHGGVNPSISLGGDNLAPAELNGWNLSATATLFYFPLSLTLNEKPALNITLVVTTPRPPLLACGGVVGLLAEKIGDKETYMTLRIVSAKCASAEKKPVR